MVFGKRAILFYIFIGCLIGWAACSETKPKKAPVSAVNGQPKQVVIPPISVKTFKNENSWGYDIFRNGKRYIHQPSKPAIGGNKGFDTELQAQKIGELVIYKIEKGIIPPSLTKVEVDSIIDQYGQ